MPELPEVEIVRQGLLAKILGETIDEVEVLREQSVGYPAPKRFSQGLYGLSFVDVSRRGKYLFLHLSKKQPAELNKKQSVRERKGSIETGNAKLLLVVHLRMSGKLLLVEKDKKRVKDSRFLRIRIRLESGKQLYFDDMRVFGRLWYVPNETLLSEIIPSLDKLGMEPLGKLAGNQLLKLFDGRRQAIKSVLLDQTILAGIGNIYADEILFQAGIHPLISAEKISNAQANALAKIIPLTLNRAIALGGSSIKDFVDTSGVNGNYQHESLVYGRTDKPCRTCQSKIERIKIAGRSAHFCPVCQYAKDY